MPTVLKNKLQTTAETITAEPILAEPTKAFDYQQSDLEEDVLAIAHLEGMIKGRNNEIVKMTKDLLSANMLDQEKLTERASRVVLALTSDCEDTEKVDQIVAGCRVKISGKPKKRAFKPDVMKLLHQQLGDMFYALVSVQLTKADQYLTLPQRELFIDTSYEDKRTINVEKLSKDDE